MTDKDVEDYSGETDVVSNYNRWLQKWFGTVPEGASDKQVASALSNEDAKFLLEHANVIGTWHDNKVKEEVMKGIEGTHSAFPSLDRRRIVELSGYENYLPIDSKGNLTSVGEQAMESTTMIVGGQNEDIYSQKVQSGVQRMLKDGLSVQEIEMSFQESNPTEPIEKIRNMINYSIKQQQPTPVTPEQISQDVNDFIENEITKLENDGFAAPTRMGASGAIGISSVNIISGVKGLGVRGNSIEYFAMVQLQKKAGRRFIA